MKTVRPRHTGFCFGVRDALQLTADALRPGEQTVALGQVVHNARALEELERKGLGRTDQLPDAGGPQVVITAHGATPQLFQEALGRGLAVVDTTCPLVRRVQRHATELAEAGLPVTVVGDAAHAEVRAVVGWASERPGSEVVVVATEAEADQLPWREQRGVVSQSTFPQPRFQQIVSRLRLRSGSVEVRDTTCPVVNQRQREAVGGLLDEADVVYALRMQHERMSENWVPSLREYATWYQINGRRLGSRQVLMHPGPVNRGVELSGEVVDSPQAVITAQVEAGVVVRMAVLYELLAGARESQPDPDRPEIVKQLA